MRSAKYMALLAWALAVLLVAGCASREPERPVPAPVSLAAAEFTQPTHVSQLLAGYVPDQRGKALPEDLLWLDATLLKLLRQSERTVAGNNAVRACQEKMLAQDSSFSGSALDYWVETGRCAGVEYLLVPQLFDWRPRKGGGAGVMQPARVMFDLYVVNVRGSSLVSRYHFEETQSSLLENLLDADRFFERGGRWLTARELAEEGLQEGLEELGF